LTPEQLEEDLGIGPGGLRENIAHTIEAMLYFAGNFAGVEWVERPWFQAEVKSVAGLRRLLGLAEAELAAPVLRACARGLASVRWPNADGGSLPLTVALAQAIDHATLHRTQAINILKRLGVRPVPDLDPMTFQATGDFVHMFQEKLSLEQLISGQFTILLAVYPSFEDPEIRGVHRGSECVARKWCRSKDLQSKVGGAPSIETAAGAIDASFVDGVLGELGALTVPVTTSARHVLIADGVRYRLDVEAGGAVTRMEWECAGPPDAWRPVAAWFASVWRALSERVGWPPTAVFPWEQEQRGHK
jgi:uncharacterized damage-inducible protein DinB